MVTIWKVLLGLVLVVPMGAYVAGSLAASAADDPAPRQTIQIREPDPTSTPTSTPSPTRTAQPDDVEVITPDYDDFDDDDDRGDDDGDDGDDRQDRHDDRHEDTSGHGGDDD